MIDPIWQHLADEIEDFYDRIREQDFIPLYLAGRNRHKAVK